MTVISVADVALSFGAKKVLDGVSFSLNEGEKMGVVGVNGCGKSTLFRIILGELEPDRGSVFLAGDKTVGMLAQNGAFTVDAAMGDYALAQMTAAFPELLRMEARLAELEHILADGSQNTALAAEYAALHERFLRAGGAEYRKRCVSTLSRMGFDEESMRRPLSTLSGGQRTRLALARELAREPDVLLLDEPTNHLDIETLTWLENYLCRYRKCVLVVSHDRWFLDHVTGKTLALEYGRGKVYAGGYTATMEARRTDRELAERRYREQQKEIARQEAYIAQQRAWNRERNIVAAESRLKLLAKMEKVERPREAPRPIRLSFTSAIPSGGEVLRVKHLSMAYGKKTLFSEVDFLLTRGERMFVVGPNGCGKSTLIKLIVGKLTPAAGRVEAGYNVEIGYYDQENQNLTPENTVLEELWNAYPDLPEGKVRGTLALFRFTGDDVFRPVSVLSGGERARLTLAKLILSHMNLLVLDEPTNHLDIDSREALETALAAFEGTVLIVSHDRALIDKLATRILALGERPLDYRVSQVGHGYEEYLAIRQKEAENNPVAAPNEQSEQKAQYLARKQDAAEARRAAARAARLKQEAAALEAELAAIEAELFGAAASDYARAAELDARKTEAEERLLAIYEEIGV